MLAQRHVCIRGIRLLHPMYTSRVPRPFGRVAAPPPHFPVGGPVPSADLVGRETYIRRIGERLADGNHVLLAGPRRIGKTSIIVEVALDLAREKNAQRFFEGALDLPRALAARTGKRVVVIFDEFQAAGRLGPRVFDVMRARFQAQRGVAYAFLGSEEGILEELFSEKGHAFYRFAVPLDLTDAGGHRFGIDPDDWLEYLRAKFAAKRLSIDDASVDRLLDATGGHPQDTMQVCAALYYLMRDSGARTVTPDFLEVAYEQAMRELERPFALHWSELGSHKYLQQVTK